PALAAGVYEVQARATDAMNNVGTDATANELTIDLTPPQASASISNVTTSGGAAHAFTVTYSDNLAMDVSDLDNLDIRVTGPDGYEGFATFVSVDPPSDGTPRTATYQIPGPGGTWNGDDDGDYTVHIQANEASDTADNFVPAGVLGAFQVRLAPATAGNWAEVGVRSARYGGISRNDSRSLDPSVLTMPNGDFVVAWADNGDNSDFDIYVRRWDGQAWGEMGAGSATGGGISNNDGLSFSPVLALGEDGHPIVVWMDRTDGDWEVYVRRWDGQAWVEMGAGSASGGGISNSIGESLSPTIGVGDDGRPVVAWSDNSDLGSEGDLGGDYEIYVRKWNPNTQTWDEMGQHSASTVGISNNRGDSSDAALAFDADGRPIVAWSDFSGGDAEIYVRRWDGLTWAEMGAGSAQGGGVSNNALASLAPSLAVGPDERPIVAWSDMSDGSDSEIYVRKWDGAAWVEVGAGSASAGGISNNGSASEWPTVVVRPNGLPVVVWTDADGTDSEIFVRQWNGSAWIEMATGSATGGGISDNDGASQSPTMTLDGDNKPVVAWTDLSGGDEEIYIRRWSTGPLPHVTSLTPNPGALLQNVPQVVVGFDVDLDFATVNANTVKLSSNPGADGLVGTNDDTYVPGTVTYSADTDTATFTPTNALAHGGYAVWLAGSTISDMAGHRLDGEYGGSFPSGDDVPGGDFLAAFNVDTVGPRVAVLSPTPGSVTTSGRDVVVTFDEGVDPATVTSATFKLYQGPAEVAGTISYDAQTRQAAFAPMAPLTDGQYRVWLDGSSSITDIAGNRLDGEFSGA
ncbi:MAG: hypothetical protein FJ279_28380, partial [Planctomycetes bacterium]|nr:hypothetical protein [Planctomycetota bacterium]